MTVSVRPVPLIVCLVALTTYSLAQARPGAFGSLPDSPQNNSRSAYRSIFLTGKTALEDGSMLPQPAAIQMVCAGHVRTLGYTDSKGGFALQLNGTNSNMLGASESDPDVYTANFGAQDCELRAELTGYISSKVDLPHSAADQTTITVGTLVLSPQSKAQGLMISATTAEAPKKARSAYEKGQNAIRKGDWQSASSNFEKAVHEFPRYAIAWQELGRVQVKLGNLEAAQDSFRSALAADPKLLVPYAELAQIALEEKRWQEVVDNTDHLLQLDPVNYPQFWFLNSAANYNLKKIDQAEKSALRGVGLDSTQRFPKMQYLLGVILALKHDYRGAALHIRNYLNLAPHAPDAQVAEKQLLECEKLSGLGN